MTRRTALLAVAASLALAAPAAAADFAETALNVIPSGQYQTPDPNADAQAQLYNSLTPRYDNVSDADLPTFFKSEALGPATVVSEETLSRPGVMIRRDDFNVPHVFGQTNDDVLFGAGWVAASDRSLLLNQGRFNGITAAIDAPNLSAIDLIRNLYQFEPSKQANAIVDRQTKVIQQAGARGTQLLHDIDVYLAGINAWYAANSPTSPRFTRRDIYAFNAIKGQFLGEGGGAEAAASQLLDALQRRFGANAGYRVWTDLRNRKDPEHTPSLEASAPYDTVTGSRKGTVTLRNGSFKREGGLRESGAPPRAEASNILIVNGQRSASGRPLFVGGPQIGYFFPGLTHEIGMYGPDIQVRGATAVPFPGYMLIGRGEDYAWTLTSAGGDIVDLYAETLCGGSRTKYLYRGRCRSMETVDAGTLLRGTTKTRVRFRRTVHGSVIGYAKTTAGRSVAISRKRSSFGRDILDQLFFQQMTFGRVKSFGDFAAAAALTPQTFNAFYADNKDIGLFTTGLLPQRPKGADGSLVNDGRGGYEWTGFLKNSKHPRGQNTASQIIVNWNNSPARGFVSGDDRFGSEGPLQRNDMLRREIARTDKHTLGSVVGAMNAGAVQDVRGYLFWPTMKRMLDKGTSPSALATAMVAQLDAWNARRAPRIDQDRDGNLDDPGVPIMDAIWTRVTDAGLCGTLGKSLCSQLNNTLHTRFSAPPGGGQYSGWHHYMDKDFRSLLGEKVKGAFSRRYCAATAKACAEKLWKAIDAAGSSLAASLGADPAAWREPRSENLMEFGPLPLIDMDYSNRPSGIQQVATFNGHR